MDMRMGPAATPTDSVHTLDSEVWVGNVTVIGEPYLGLDYGN